MSNDITLIDLSSLTLSAHNTRRTGGKDVSDLAASIASQGLLQNLIVEELVDTVERTAEPGEALPEIEYRYAVIAGGRRLAALQKLASKDKLPAALAAGIPCKVVSDPHQVLEASTAENIVRQAMHTHDEIVAFRDMHATGNSVDDIAARFGCSAITVQRRLRLANVSPVLLRLHRDGEATLDQLTALAITDDWVAQERVWKDAGDEWGRQPKALRRALTDQHISSDDKRVTFIGLDTYEAEGGAVTRDLFSAMAYIADEALLDKLVEFKLCEIAGQLRAEGWSWVKVLEHNDHSFEYKFNRSQPKRTEETAETIDEMARITVRLAELNAKHTASDDDIDDEEFDEIEQLESRAEALKKAAAHYTDRQKAKAGAAVRLKHDGSLDILRGLIPQDAATERTAAKSTVTDDGKPVPIPPPALAESMVRRLSAHRTIALQRELLKRADVSLAILAHRHLLPLICERDYDSNVRDTNPLDITTKRVTFTALGMTDVDASTELAEVNTIIADLCKTLAVPSKPALLLPWLLQQSRDTVVALLAAVPAMTLDAVIVRATDDPKAVAITDALKLDMADHWQPTADTFFSLVPRAIALEAVTEAAGKDQAARLATMKKAELAGEAERLTHRTGWLPKPLRRPGYALRTTAPSADDQPEQDTPSEAQRDTAHPTIKTKPSGKPAAKASKVAKAKPANKRKPATKKAAA